MRSNAARTYEQISGFLQKIYGKSVECAARKAIQRRMEEGYMEFVPIRAYIDTYPYPITTDTLKTHSHLLSLS